MCWVKIHRKLLDWEWASCPDMMALWIYLLLSANYEDRNWKGQVIVRGQMVTSRSHIATATGLSERSVRTCLERLVATSEIIVKTTNKFSMITICKYDSYQLENQDTDQQTTSKRPTNDQQTTTTKEIKNKRNKEYISLEEVESEVKASVCKTKKEYAPSVRLLESEYLKLTEKFSETDVRWILDKLSSYKITHNKRYASDYGAINSWVIKALDNYKKEHASSMYKNEDYW